MAHLVQWVVDPPEFKWEHDLSTNTIVATTTMVVRTYVHLGHVHERDVSDIPPFSPPAPAALPRAFLGQPLGPWDFPLEPLPDIPMEPMSPRLPGVEP